MRCTHKIVSDFEEKERMTYTAIRHSLTLASVVSAVLSS